MMRTLARLAPVALVAGKPLGLTIAWVNRRGVALDPAVPRPDVILDDVASLLPLLAYRPDS